MPPRTPFLQADIDVAVKGLLALKADYEKETGKKWTPGSTPAAAAAASKAAPQKEKSSPKLKQSTDSAKGKKGTSADPKVTSLMTHF